MTPLALVKGVFFFFPSPPFFPRQINSNSGQPLCRMFSPPVFITIGDEYDKRDQLPERYKGKNLKCSPGKKGNLNDALFQKQFLSLSQGDKYIDPGLYDKRSKLESEKKKLTPQGFKYSNPPHKPNGSGTFFGTFSEKNPPKYEFNPERIRKSGEKPEVNSPQAHLKNFVTNPPRKGTFGFPNTTIGHGDEYKYVSDPYEGEKRRSALQAKESAKKIVGPAFKSASRKCATFDETPHGGAKVYSIDKPLPAKHHSGEHKAVPLAKAWRPGGTLVPTIHKPPEYQEDPFEAKEKRMREERRAQSVTNKAVWKPIGGSKSLPTRAIKFTPTD